MADEGKEAAVDVIILWIFAKGKCHKERASAAEESCELLRIVVREQIYSTYCGHPCQVELHLMS
jgi:hypothetical protein